MTTHWHHHSQSQLVTQMMQCKLGYISLSGPGGCFTNSNGLSDRATDPLPMLFVHRQNALTPVGWSVAVSETPPCTLSLLFKYVMIKIMLIKLSNFIFFTQVIRVSLSPKSSPFLCNFSFYHFYRGAVPVSNTLRPTVESYI